MSLAPYPRLSAPVFIAVLALFGCGGEGPADTATSTSSAGAGGAGNGVGGMGAGGAGAGGNIDAGGMGGAGGAALPIAGFGEISGMCGEIEPDELVTGSPAFVINNTLDFGMLMFDKNQLCPGGLTLFNEPNLGGNSKYSEVFAYEMLYRCELATLLKTEANIVYAVEGKKTDFLAEIDGLKVGVSVTRAYKYMAPFTTNDALALLTKKLSDINQSTQNVAPEDAWGKQILHVLAYDPEYLPPLQTAYANIDTTTRADTIVVVTLTNGDDEYLYTSN